MASRASLCQPVTECQCGWVGVSPGICTPAYQSSISYICILSSMYMYVLLKIKYTPTETH